MQVTTADSVKYKYDFLKYRSIWLFVSIAYIVVGVGFYIAKGGFSYHIDFTGGAELRVSFEKPSDISTVRGIISAKGWKDASIQSVGSTGKNFIIRVGSLDSDTEAHIKRDLTDGMDDNKVHIDNVSWVGAEVGKDTKTNAITAILISLFFLLLYIAVRFEFRFGIGAVLSLVHDLLAILAFILVFNESISLHVLAAILAILGYSMNDTIVIFSRIRENLSKLKGISEYDLVNLSINQTLRRTLLTSSATLLSVLAILLLGGETLRGLSLVMFIGIIVGTYSSIYIASPVMMLAGKAKK
ncbi:protein translocase subunit SecF [Candidatus Dependentiae bacterium]|jgi:preprotein translocase subunit SecF|nr:protein translocase subunit SecF [Candidatus Dependentiae bacterium]